MAYTDTERLDFILNASHRPEFMLTLNGSSRTELDTAMDLYGVPHKSSPSHESHSAQDHDADTSTHD